MEFLIKNKGIILYIKRQESLWAIIGEPSMNKALEGHNSIIISYG